MLTRVSTNMGAYVWAISVPVQPAGPQAGCLPHGTQGLQCSLCCKPCPLMMARAWGSQEKGLTSEDFRAKAGCVPTEVDVRTLGKDERVGLVEGVATWGRPTVDAASGHHTTPCRGGALLAEHHPPAHTHSGYAGSSPASLDTQIVSSHGHTSLGTGECACRLHSSGWGCGCMWGSDQP